MKRIGILLLCMLFLTTVWSCSPADRSSETAGTTGETTALTPAETSAAAATSAPPETENVYPLLPEDRFTPTIPSAEKLAQMEMYVSPAASAKYRYGTKYVDSSHGVVVRYEEEQSGIYPGETTPTLWTRSTDFFVMHLYEVHDGVIAAGVNRTEGGGSVIRLVRYDGNGEKLFDRDFGFEKYSICTGVYENSDGTLTVLISQSSGVAAPYDRRVFRLCSADGKMLSEKIYTFSAQNTAARSVLDQPTMLLADGNDEYIFLEDGQIVTYTPDGTVKRKTPVDLPGEGSASLVYSSIKQNGKLFLEIRGMRTGETGSGTEPDVYFGGIAVPASDISSIFDGPTDRTDEEGMRAYAARIRDRVCVSILCVDLDSGEQILCGSFPGAIEGSLFADGGGIVYDAHYPVAFYNSPYTDSFSIAGTCVVCRFTFDAEGKPIGTEELNLVTGYRR